MHWLNNLLFYALGFGTCLLMVIFACMVTIGERADREIDRILDCKMDNDDRLEEIERRKVISDDLQSL